MLFGQLTPTLFHIMDDTKLFSPSMLLALLVIPCMIFMLDRIIVTKPSAKEPPYISPKIPLIGHAIGLLRYNFEYYVNLRCITLPELTIVH